MLIIILVIAIYYAFYRFLRCLASCGSVRTGTVIDRFLRH